MVNIFLIIVIIVMAIMLLLGSFYVLVYFQSEEDKNTAYAPKVAVVLGFTLAALFVLMLPLDVANRMSDGGLDMSVMWQVMYIAVAVMCIAVIPYLMFYYESEDPESTNWQCWTAIKYEFVALLIVTVVFVLMWLFLGYADVPVNEYQWNSTLLSATAPLDCDACDVSGELGHVRISVTPIIYLVALVAFVGWFLFICFAGVGFAALPLDLIFSFVHRPVPIDLQVYAQQKALLNERASKLLEVGQSLGMEAHRAHGRKSTKKYNKFKQAVYFLEKDWDKVKVAYKDRGGNPLLHGFRLLLGVVSAILTICWFVHLVLYKYINPPASQFLNGLFDSLDSVFPLFGVVAYGLFSFYLLFCVLKGNMKVGLRFFWIPIHPMRIGATLMNSMLFNVWLLLLCSFSVVQFCFEAFSSYARLTAVDMQLGVEVHYMAYLGWFYQKNVFLYILTAITLLSCIVLSIRPQDKPALDIE